MNDVINGKTRAELARGLPQSSQYAAGNDSMAKSNTIRIAALADIHYKKTPDESFQPVFAEINGKADVLLLCGDLTDYGLPEEAELVVKDLAPVKLPILAVLGNHDYESGRVAEVRDVLTRANIKVLDGESAVVAGVGFAGAKGFCGGFGTRMLEPWGELAIKNFVKEAIDETLKLESALARLRTPHRIVLLHYAPIQATVEGEPLEIFAYMGSGRLEDPINRYGADAVFHGHAHRGAPEGATSRGVPVFNVSVSLLRRVYPDKPPYRIFEIQLDEEEAANPS
jgi:Icc-related predicted phosphoesterase